MNAGTKFMITLIADERTEKFGTFDINLQIRKYRELLNDNLINTGIEITEIGKEHFLDKWRNSDNTIDNTAQIRQSFWLELTKNKTKNEVYNIINSVRSQPLKFYK